MIYLSYIANEVHPEAGNEYFFEFITPDISQITESSLLNKSQDVLTQPTIEFDLDIPDTLNTIWMVESNPEAEFEITRDYSKKISITPKEPLNQGTKYKLKIYRIPAIFDLVTEEIVNQRDPELSYELEFTTINAPLISSVSPRSSGVLVSTPIVIEFDSEMSVASVENNLEINPNISGEYSWSEDKKTRIESQNVKNY